MDLNYLHNLSRDASQYLQSADARLFSLTGKDYVACSLQRKDMRETLQRMNQMVKRAEQNPEVVDPTELESLEQYFLQSMNRFWRVAEKTPSL